MYFPIAERLTLAYVSVFLLSCVGQLATGFFEETVSKGLVMSRMLSKWKNTVCGRICAVLFSGVLFGTLHLLNVLFSGNLVECMWQSLYASAFKIFVICCCNLFALLHSLLFACIYGFYNTYNFFIITA